MVIYLTTNVINGKKYIGKDTKNKNSYLGSGKFLKQAIVKYGKENFKKEILEYCNNEIHLREREEYWLNYYDAANNTNFYNCHNVSYGCPKDVHKGRKNTWWDKSINTRKPNSGWNEESKQKQSEVLKGRKVTWGNKIAKSRKGKPTGIDYTTRKSIKGRPRSKTAGKPPIPVLQYDKKGNFIKEWDSISNAEKWLCKGDIRSVLDGKTKTAGGYIWKNK